MSPNITKNSVFLISAYVLQKAFTFFYFIVVARSFGPHEQGQYSAALAFAALFAVFIDFGTAAVVTRETAKTPEQAGKLFGSMLLFRLGASVLVYGLILITATFVGYHRDLIALIALAGVVTVLETLSTSIWAVFRGLHTLFHESIAILISGVCMVGFGLLFIALSKPISFLFFALILASCANFLYGLFILTQKFHIPVSFRVDGEQIKKLLQMSLPFVSAALCSRIYTQSDLALLARMAGDAAAGWYAAGNKIILALQLIPGGFAAALFPALSSYVGKENGRARIGRTYEQAMVVLCMLAVPCGCLLSFLAAPLTLFVYTDAYSPTIDVMRILGGSLVFGFLSYPSSALLAAVGQQKVNTILGACAAIVSIGGNILLIPSFGILASSWLSLATNGFLFVAGMACTRHYWVDRIILLGRRITLILCSGVGMALTLIFLGERFPFLIVASSGVVVYGLLLFCFGVLSIKELRRLIASIYEKNPSRLS